MIEHRMNHCLIQMILIVVVNKVWPLQYWPTGKIWREKRIRKQVVVKTALNTKHCKEHFFY